MLPAWHHMPAAGAAVGWLDTRLEQWQDHRPLRRVRDAGCRIRGDSALEARQGYSPTPYHLEQERVGMRRVLLLLGRCIQSDDLLHEQIKQGQERVKHTNVAVWQIPIWFQAIKGASAV
jgi:hypothetical protein